MLQAGVVVDRYEVESLLGEGAVGRVYRVRHRALGTRFAMKILHLTSPSALARMQREARVQAELRHPNVVSVHDLVEIDGCSGVVMDLVDGPTLAEWMQRRSPDLLDTLTLFRGIAEGVAAAHARGLVHRDLKPANILIDQSSGKPVPRVTDFGLVRVIGEPHSDNRMTLTGTIMGTPAYMAPEQFRDASRADPRADIFSLGCILYELCCRQMAFPQSDLLEAANAIRAEAYIAPHALAPALPDRVESAIRACLKADPASRPPDCAALLSMLSVDPAETCVSPPGELAAPEMKPWGPPTLEIMPPAASVGMPDAERRPRVWAIGALLGIALATFLLSFGLVGRRGGHSSLTAADGVDALALSPTSPNATATELPPLETEVPPAQDAPPEPVEAGRVGASGDARRVWLERNGQRHDLGEVPPGRYLVYATFDDGGTLQAGQVTVRPGQSVRLNCSSSFRRCAP